MKNNQKGITLVALVITIIVLLILAGVTIAALQGNSGLLARGSEAVVNTNIQNVKDVMQSAIAECLANYYDERYVKLSTTSDDITGYIIKHLDENDTVKKMITDTTQCNYNTTKNDYVADSKKSASIEFLKVHDAADKNLTITFDEGGKGTYTWTNDALKAIETE